MSATLRSFVRLKKLFNKPCHRELSSSMCLFENKQEIKETHFGFQSVPEDEKEDKVHEVFRNVADKYDLMNDAMSVGIHRLWKDLFIKKLSPTPGTKLIDVAGGTGDIAFRYLDYVHSLKGRQRSSKSNNILDRNVGGDLKTDSDEQSNQFIDNDRVSFTPGDAVSDCQVTVCDINQSMLNVGKERAQQTGKLTGISWIKGNAESLPFANNSFDAYTIAFGIRNCTHVDQVIKEAYRVLKPGGRFMCLEFSRVTNPLLRSAYDEYSFQVIPVLGQILASDWQSYQYLVESIRQFPAQEEFKDMIKTAGFTAVTYENLTFGIVAIHSGFKL